jgi:hypothetical protein
MHALILFMVAVSQDQQLYPVQKQLSRLQAQMRTLKLAGAAKTALAAQGQPKNCSIPLLDALKGEKPPANPMPVKKPEGEFHIRLVTPPAPPCENWGR